MNSLRLSLHRALLAILAVAGLSCDLPTAPRTGAIAVLLVVPARTAESQEAAVSGVAELRSGPGASADLVLNRARLTLTDGPTPRTVESATPVTGFFELVADGLEPGSYTVTVEGFVGADVAHFGRTSGVTVAAGETKETPVTFALFQPVIPNAAVVDSVDVLRYTLNYSAVTGATGYVVDWSTSPAMVDAQRLTVAGTSVAIALPGPNTYYARVQATNAQVPNGGIVSETKRFLAYQGVAAASVSPATPSVVAGATQQLAAEGRDADNVVVPGVSWFWSSSNQAVATVSQTGLVTAVAGGSTTITAVGKGTPGSTTVTVTPRPAAQLAFLAPPTSTTAGTTFAPVRVAVRDEVGATVTGDNTTQVTLAIGTDAGPGGALAGLATVTAAAGVATFSNLSLATAGAGYTLTAAAPGLTGSTSPNFDILPGAATQLAFTVPPSAAAAAAAISPAVQVTVRDALGNRVTGASAAVTVAIGTNPGNGTLTGTAVVNAVSGVASFSGLAISVGGVGYTLTASAPALTGATSPAFTITAPLPASTLAFSAQPPNVMAGREFSSAIQVEVRNSSGQRITTARNPVTLSFAVNTANGTITGTTTANAIAGIASFSGLWVNKAAAGYTLAAAAPGLTGATSTPFTVSPAAAAKLAFVTQPTDAQGNVAMSGTLTAHILDAFENLVPTATSNVTLGLFNNPYRGADGPGGTMSATTSTVATVGGVATWTGVKVDKPARGYTARASATGFAAVESDSFDINVVFDGTISAGSNSHACAISTTSGTYCWGSGWTGQLGTGLSTTDSIAARVLAPQPFTSVSAGIYHTCALTAAGTAYCWGANWDGQLGNGSTDNSNVPIAVSGSLSFSVLRAGGYHTCGVTTPSATEVENQQVYCWGANWSGQLGTGDFNSAVVPTRVATFSGFATKLDVGNSHTCAINIDQNAYCWGAGGSGQLGNGFSNTSNVPVLVSGNLLWTSIDAGQNHTCGLTTTGGTNSVARCFGGNASGQLGNSTVTSSNIPVAVSGNFANWSNVSAGASFSCGIRETVPYCWGTNFSGQLGNDDVSGTSSNQPATVAGGFAFQQIEAGGGFACARATSTVYCWGSNSDGRLGIPGTNNVRRSPTAIIQ